MRGQIRYSAFKIFDLPCYALVMLKTIEVVRFSDQERIVSPEEWEALSELLNECLRRDIPVIFSFDTARSQALGSKEVVQDRQGFTLEINYWCFPDGSGGDKHYRSIGELVADGWNIINLISVTDGSGGMQLGIKRQE